VTSGVGQAAREVAEGRPETAARRWLAGVMVVSALLFALDTVMVGPNTYLLHNVGYTETIARLGNAVYAYDATQ